MANQRKNKNNPASISKRKVDHRPPIKVPEKTTKLTGSQKVAILMVALGSDVSASILKNLKEDEVQAISREIANIKKVTPEEKEKVLDEFKEIIHLRQFISKGGEDTAKDILMKAFGADKADEIVSNIHEKLHKKPFQFLNEVEPEEIVLLLKGEHPQTIALTLSFLNPSISSKVLKDLPQDIRAGIAKRIATLNKTSPGAIEEVEKILSQKLQTISTEKIQRVDGVNVLAEILNNMDRETESNIMGSIEDENIELAQEIKENMFIFEDIVKLSKQEMQKLIEIASIQDIALALKGAEDELRNQFFDNMSKNRREEIIDEMDLLGQVRYRDVHSAQQNLLNLLKILEAQGEAYLKDRNSEEYII